MTEPGPLTRLITSRIGDAVERARQRTGAQTSPGTHALYMTQLVEAGRLLDRYLSGTAVDLAEPDIVSAFDRVGVYYR